FGANAITREERNPILLGHGTKGKDKKGSQNPPQNTPDFSRDFSTYYKTPRLSFWLNFGGNPAIA
ncbi:MAG: hypothetical protein ACKO5Q_22310, partial [Microcystaceae cyanobacterium]